MGKKLHLKSEIGRLGEDIACKFLMKHGFAIKDCNYLKKWGEIDIVALKAGVLSFFEVKSVSREIQSLGSFGLLSDHATLNMKQGALGSELNATLPNPAELITPSKLKKLERVIQSYLLEVDWKGEWELKGVLVYVNRETREARVEVVSL